LTICERLDLGCGTSVNLALTPGTYQHYHGVDINVIVGQSGENTAADLIPAPQNRTYYPQLPSLGVIVGQKWRYSPWMTRNDENSPLAHGQSMTSTVTGTALHGR
jgi:hypothetical protein